MNDDYGMRDGDGVRRRQAARVVRDQIVIHNGTSSMTFLNASYVDRRDLNDSRHGYYVLLLYYRGRSVRIYVRHECCFKGTPKKRKSRDTVCKIYYKSTTVERNEKLELRDRTRRTTDLLSSMRILTFFHGR